jgi:hypothetical protein
MVLGLFDLIGNLLLFVVVVCWVGFIGFILFAICGLIYFAFEDAFDGIANPLDDLRNWWRHSERVNRYRAILRIKWTIWRAIRRLEDQAKRRGP